MKNKILEYKGITLIGLIVTIIILLILSGISIAILTGNGLFEKAKLAKEKQENAQKLEDSILKEYEEKIQGIRNSKFEESKIIDDFTIVTKNISTNKITINLSENTSTEYVIGYIVFIGNDAIDVTNTMPYDILNLQKDTEYIDIYVVAIDNKGNMKQSSNKLNERTANMLTEGLVDFWPLEESLNNEIKNGSGELVVCKGNFPNFTSEGAYLDNIVLSTKDNYNLSDEFSIIFQINATKINEWSNVVGKKISFVNSCTTTGLFMWNSNTNPIIICGNNNYILPGKSIYEVGKKATIAITHDGDLMSVYVNGKLTNCKNTVNTQFDAKFYIGGSSLSGQDAGSGVLEGYSPGYYKNIMIYNRALTQNEINSFEI